MAEHSDHPIHRDPATGLQLLTLSEAARELCRSTRTLRRWRQLGVPRTIRIGAGIYVTRAEIEHLVEPPDG
jgi:hypothetical protein